MTVMVLEVCDALRSAGVEDGPARRAAEAMAREQKFDDLGARIEKLENKIDARFTKVDDRLGEGERRTTRIEARLDLLVWMVGIMMTLTGGVLTGTIVMLWRGFARVGA